MTVTLFDISIYYLHFSLGIRHEARECVSSDCRVKCPVPSAHNYCPYSVFIKHEGIQKRLLGCKTFHMWPRSWTHPLYDEQQWVLGNTLQQTQCCLFFFAGKHGDAREVCVIQNSQPQLIVHSSHNLFLIPVVFQVFQWLPLSLSNWEVNTKHIAIAPPLRASVPYVMLRINFPLAQRLMFYAEWTPKPQGGQWSTKEVG